MERISYSSSASPLPSTDKVTSVRYRLGKSPRLSPRHSPIGHHSLESPYASINRPSNPSVDINANAGLGLGLFCEREEPHPYPTFSRPLSLSSSQKRIHEASERSRREKPLPPAPVYEREALHIAEMDQGVSLSLPAVSQANIVSCGSSLPTPNYAGQGNFFNDVFGLFRPAGNRPSAVRTDTVHSEKTIDSASCYSDHRSEQLQRQCDSPVGRVRPTTVSPLDSSYLTALPRLSFLNTVPKPQAKRTKTGYSTKSARTTRSQTTVDSVDSGRSSLLTIITTTDKFTHKWPRPKPVRGVSLRDESDSSKLGKGLLATPDSLSSALENGVGLGMESVGKWTSHKWFLMFSVATVFLYGLLALIFALSAWYKTWPHAEVMATLDSDLLILTTLSSMLLLLASLVGTTGTLLNARPLLAIYVLLLWPAFISILTVGYISYKREIFSLDRKLSQSWSQYLSDADRGTIQDSLSCCGFYDTVHDAIVSSQCYPRSPLPGCKAALLDFERVNLGRVWSMAFSFVPLHVLNIVIALLCSNHVNERFGKGIMPRQYWLGIQDVKQDAQALMEHFKDATRRPPAARTGSNVSASYWWSNRADRTRLVRTPSSRTESMKAVYTGCISSPLRSNSTMYLATKR